jgi:hypothetical protein
MFEGVTNADELIAAFQNFKGKRTGGDSGRTAQGRFAQRRLPPRDSGGAARPPRKCANCGETHDARTCPKPSVAVSDRKCWTCGEKHMAKDCPQKGKDVARPIRAIEDGVIAAIDAGALAGFFAVDHEGFQTVQHGKRRTPEPPGGVCGGLVLHTDEASRAETPGREGSLHGGHRVQMDNSRNLQNLNRTSRPMPTTATLGSFMSKNVFDILGGEKQHDTTSVPVALASPVAHAQRRVLQHEAGNLTTETDGGYGKTTATTVATTRPHDTTRLVTSTTPSGNTARPTIADLRKRQKEVVSQDVSLTAMMAAVQEAERISQSINAIEYSGPVQSLCSLAETIKVRVAMDSAACDNVINPDELPSDAEYVPNEDDKHFVGANNSPIERYGSCKTVMESSRGKVGCTWQMAAVSRALHSVGVVAGPKGGPGKQDILFNNEKCYVVAPGIVKKIMEHCKAVAEYDREGNLYIGEMTLSSFHRQGLSQ